MIGQKIATLDDLDKEDKWAWLLAEAARGQAYVEIPQEWAISPQYSAWVFAERGREIQVPILRTRDGRQFFDLREVEL